MVVVCCLVPDSIVLWLFLWLGFTKFILTTSACSNCYRLQNIARVTKYIVIYLTLVVKAWFQEHGNNVHDGLVKPNHQAASILKKTVATWLHTSPWLQ